MNKLFIDSWGWITIGNKKEPENKKVITFYNDFIKNRGIVFTTDYIFSEAITMLFKKIPFIFAEDFMKNVFEAVRLGYVKLEFISHERFKKAWDLRLRFNDKPKISFTDFTSFVIMDELSIKDVLTGDVHFEIVNMGFKKVL